MKNSNVTKGNLLSNKMEVDLNMLRPLMLHRIAGEIDGTGVIAIGQSSTARGALELNK
jgi:poly-beta-hydroxyalkanoate depolymerase